MELRDTGDVEAHPSFEKASGVGGGNDTVGVGKVNDNY